MRSETRKFGEHRQVGQGDRRRQVRLGKIAAWMHFASNQSCKLNALGNVSQSWSMFALIVASIPEERAMLCEAWRRHEDIERFEKTLD